MCEVILIGKALGEPRKPSVRQMKKDNPAWMLPMPLLGDFLLHTQSSSLVEFLVVEIIWDAVESLKSFSFACPNYYLNVCKKTAKAFSSDLHVTVCYVPWGYF